MEQFAEILCVISMFFTAGMMIVLNVMEDRQEKREAKLREAKEAHEEIKPLRRSRRECSPHPYCT